MGVMPTVGVMPKEQNGPMIYAKECYVIIIDHNLRIIK
jgi:hypothetical protein